VIQGAREQSAVLSAAHADNAAEGDDADSDFGNLPVVAVQLAERLAEAERQNDELREAVATLTSMNKSATAELEQDAFALTDAGGLLRASTQPTSNSPPPAHGCD
jgi:hypothetical protein